MAHSDAFFLSLDGADRFCMLHEAAPNGASRGSIVFVHPFAEEMNRCRRMAALQARAFADNGWTVLQMDFYGCGDSAGEFGDATWMRWMDDLVAAAEWIRLRSGHRPHLWAARGGALLASQLAQTMQPTPDLILWQPAVSGAQVLQHFLRLQVANQILGPAQGERTGTLQLRKRLLEGAAVEVAGYLLGADLARGLDAAEFRPPPPPARVAWFEIAGEAGAELSPAAGVRIEAWRSAGHVLDVAVVQGPPFWHTLENSECPALIESTLALVQGWRR